MDITMLFKACVKTIRTRNKAFGTNADIDKTRSVILRKSARSEFVLKANEIVGQVTRLKDLLIEHRKAYLNFASLLSDTPQLSDIERDKIDAGAQQIMTTCSHLIHDLKKAHHFEGSLQLQEHRKAVVDLMENYLKTVCKIYSEQRITRVKRSLETQKLSKLEFEHKPGEVPVGLLRNNISEKTKPEALPNQDHSNQVNQSQHLSVGETVDPSNCASNTLLEPIEDSLSPEEMQLFESENAQLYNEMNSLTEEVKQIESKVVHIAELQEIFTEKVLQQEADIDRIATTVVGTTENVKDANEQIREAIQRNAGLRVWVLFFLLIMSFSLLFLDWYND